MAEPWSTLVTKWTEAGVIDADTAGRIRAYEGRQTPAATLKWPIVLALAFGALLLGSGALLFVSAHWDTLSPAARFALVLGMVAVFHLAGAATAARFPPLATTLHALGTVSLGAGIALAGQIFNLDEHWPSGVMLWAIGAAAAWLLRRDPAQLGLVATLLPAWLVSEWVDDTRWWAFGATGRVAASFVFLLAIAYFTASSRDRSNPARRVLLWVGGLALLPAAGMVSENFSHLQTFDGNRIVAAVPLVMTIGWIVAIGLPLVVAFWTRRSLPWQLALAALWTLVLVNVPREGDAWWVYAWWGLGSIAFVAWGVVEASSERINLGAVLFASTVLAFYFSEIMNKLDRSASLVGLGLLFLGGGWALERARRQLIHRAKGAAS